MPPPVPGATNEPPSPNGLVPSVITAGGAPQPCVLGVVASPSNDSAGSASSTITIAGLRSDSRTGTTYAPIAWRSGIRCCAMVSAEMKSSTRSNVLPRWVAHALPVQNQPWPADT